MQGQLLRSSSAVCKVVTNCHLPGMFFSKTEMHVEKMRRLSTVVCMNRKGPKTIRFFSGTEKVEFPNSTTDSSADGLSKKDSGTRNESLRETSSTVTAPLPHVTAFRELHIADHHLLLLGFMACVVTGALSFVLIAAIPTLIALKQAAESLGKLADTAREELPGTMAAVRLSGMEISDLTMELSDLGQEISAGVRSSSRAVRAAEDSLRRIGSFTSIAVLQDRVGGQVEVVKPAVARAARSTRQALVRARSLVRGLMTLTHFSSWFARYWNRLDFRRQATPAIGD